MSEFGSDVNEDGENGKEVNEVEKDSETHEDEIDEELSKELDDTMIPT